MATVPGDGAPGLPVSADEAQAAAGQIQVSSRRSPAVHELLEALRRLGRDDHPAWICGELGAGRHTAALCLHALSARRTGPLRVLHGSELVGPPSRRSRPSSQVQGAPPLREPWPAEEARLRLEDALQEAAGGTVIIDEGGAPNLDLQALLAEMLRMPLPARLVLITALPGRNSPRPGGGAEGAPAPFVPVMLRELSVYLSPRCARVPALRLRREEILPLASELLRLATPKSGAPPFGAPAGEELTEVSAPPTPASGLTSASAEGEAAAELAAEAAAGTGATGPGEGAEAAGTSPPISPITLASAAGATLFTDEAVRLLEEHPFPGNLWQLRLSMLQVSRTTPPGRPVSADDLRRVLPLGAPGESAHEPGLLYQMGQALGDLLRTLLPVLPAGETDADAVAQLRAALVLYQDPLDPPWLQRLRRGHGALDETRLVAGLQARPLGMTGGTRTGDAPVLSRLGPTWRGHLLGLLRAAHKELDDAHAPSLNLLALGQLLMLAGPPIPSDKLVRLALGLPVDMQEEETAAMLERLGLLQRRQPGAARLQPCQSPTIGRSWADAVRGLLSQRARRQFQQHAHTCERCCAVLLGFWRLPDLQTAVRQEILVNRALYQATAPADAPPAPAETEDEPLFPQDPAPDRPLADGSPGHDDSGTLTPTSEQTQLQIGTAQPPASLLRGRDLPPETAPEDPRPPAEPTRALDAPRTAPPAAPTFFGVLTAAHWIVLLLLLGLALVAGAQLGPHLR